MSSNNSKQLIRRQVGGLPLLGSIMQRTKLRSVLLEYLPSHGNEKIASTDTLILLIYNLALGKSPLYKLSDWVKEIDLACININPNVADSFNDDRFGRALDKLYLLDRATLMTQFTVMMTKAFSLQLTRIHNDSTSIKAYGKIPGKTNTGLELRHGFSKDHRPDLKQLVFSLSVSADGAVPVHYKSYPGNRTDDTTHIETWKTLRKLRGDTHFLYVADSKLCTDTQLSYIVQQNGRAITIMPETWSEVNEFKNKLRRKKINKIPIWRRQKSNDETKTDYFSCYEGHYRTQKQGFRIHWIFSSEKKKNDQLFRNERLKKAETALTQLNSKLNTYHLKKRLEIQQAVDKIVNEHKVTSFIKTEINCIHQTTRKKIGRGRPGKQTRYRMQSQMISTLTWYRCQDTLKNEVRVDGVFPLLSTDDSLSPKEVLQAYKYQPRLEKRFCQFKSIHNAAPLFFKNIERVEANLFAFFVALVLQALLEREIRESMKKNNIQGLDIYPEERESKFPTTNSILNAFNGVSRYKIIKDRMVIEEYKDKLSETQLQVLELLGMSEKEYWGD